MDDEPDIQETARFWRLNSIEALRLMPRLETHGDRFPYDEEHLKIMKDNSAELAALEAREKTVKARYNRLKSKQGAPMTRTEPAVKLDPDEWEKGYMAGITGKAGPPPHGLAYSSGLIEGQADKGLIPIDPKLRANFDNTPNEERSPAEIEKWWNKPFIVSTTFEGNQADQDYDAYFERVKDYDFKAYPTKTREEWEADQAQQKADWYASFPSGTRYEVYCLDGGAWDRATWRGMFAKLSEAVRFAKSGQTFTAHRPNQAEIYDPKAQP